MLVLDEVGDDGGSGDGGGDEGDVKLQTFIFYFSTVKENSLRTK